MSRSTRERRARRDASDVAGVGREREAAKPGKVVRCARWQSLGRTHGLQSRHCCRDARLTRCFFSEKRATDEKRQATRLETRTKESTMRASMSLTKMRCAMKVTKVRRAREGGGSTDWTAAERGSSPRPLARSRQSTHAGTRKMVNYAWGGRSQRKLWWRLAAVLTCKSIVTSGHRGERLIEPSSSWFPPKFPSG